jgi:hypothetical protein
VAGDAEVEANYTTAEGYRPSVRVTRVVPSGSSERVHGSRNEQEEWLWGVNALISTHTRCREILWEP